MKQQKQMNFVTNKNKLLIFNHISDSQDLPMSTVLSFKFSGYGTQFVRQEPYLVYC